MSDKVENDLQCIISHTISNVIRQLSSLSKHAENLFAEIFNEANSYLERTAALEKRVTKLAVDVTELDPVQEEGASNFNSTPLYFWRRLALAWGYKGFLLEFCEMELIMKISLINMIFGIGDLL